MWRLPITQIRFGARSDPPSPDAWDIHVLRGFSVLALRSRLQVRDRADRKWKAFDTYSVGNHDVAVEFRPVFNAVESPTEFQGFGITVNKDTGEISTTAGPVANQPHNFIVEAVVVRNTGGDDVDNAVIRIHLHDSITRIFLTPETLTVRRPADPSGTGTQYNPNTRYAFTVRALFDDHTIGDVTFAPELGIWTPEDFFWLDADSGIQRISIPANTQLGAPIQVKIATSAFWGSHEATGHIMVRQPWEVETDLPAIEWVDGHPSTLDETLTPEHVPNVLFLACGFPDPSRPFFEQHTGLLVKNLTTTSLLQPYSYLAKSLNFWRLSMRSQAPASPCVLKSIPSRGVGS
jgi:hypothetical protein